MFYYKAASRARTHARYTRINFLFELVAVDSVEQFVEIKIYLASAV